jgi:hypothetical protein
MHFVVKCFLVLLEFLHQLLKGSLSINCDEGCANTAVLLGLDFDNVVLYFFELATEVIYGIDLLLLSILLDCKHESRIV